MPLSLKITPYETSFKVMVDQTLGVEARNDRVAAAARQIIARADDKNRTAFGVVPPKKITVNGHEDDGSLQHVVPPDSGSIIDEYRLVEDVLAWIMMTLKARSPVISGEYRDGHRLFADDVEVSDPAHPPLASQYSFFNLTPYARRLEIGKTKSGRDFLIQVPNRIYERTADDAKARFGNVAKITKGFASTPESYRLKVDQPTRSFKGGVRRVSLRQRADRVAGSAVTVPAIYVTIG
jgi:hypothetical protein